MIKAVLFDLGNTLINFHNANIVEAFRAGAKTSYDYLAGLGISMPDFARYHRHQLWAIRFTYAISYLTGREFNSRDLLARVSRKLGIDVPPEHLDELTWRWYEPLSNQSQCEPNVHQVLQQLQQLSVKLAIVSNTFVPGSSLDRHLDREGLLEFFPVRIYSCEVGVRKPKKKIFQLALQQTQTLPHETVFVGDIYRVDIRGAQRAGLLAVQKIADPAAKPRIANRFIRIKHLSELPETLKHLGGAPPV